MKNNSVKLIIKMLKESGYKAYVVGGAIRDYILNNVPNDFDISTNALPDQILDVFKDYQTICIGKKFGTIGVIIDNKCYEITTFRIEEEYINHRKPKKIQFVDELKTDLSRRDFTINAIAYDDGEIIDYFGGQDDIEKKLIRTVGNPYKRFEEDGLRVLRCFRFAATLGFEIENETELAAKNCFNYIYFSSPERRSQEIKKMINGSYFKNVLVKYFSLFKGLLKIFEYDEYIDYINTQSFENKILIMYYKHPKLIFEDLELLEIKKSCIDKFNRIFKCVNYIDFSNEKDIRKKVSLLIKNTKKAKEILLKAIELKYNLNIINKEIYSLYIEKINNALKLPYSTEHLVFKGIDLINMGICKEDIISILNEILYKIISDDLNNDYNSIKEYIINNFL